MKKEDKYIVINSLRNRRRTAPDLAADFNEHHTTKVRTTTVKRRLLGIGLKGRVAVKKPRLTTVHKQKRLVCAKERKNWTVKARGRIVEGHDLARAES